jgi:hypothetical protein
MTSALAQRSRGVAVIASIHPTCDLPCDVINVIVDVVEIRVVEVTMVE